MFTAILSLVVAVLLSKAVISMVAGLIGRFVGGRVSDHVGTKIQEMKKAKQDAQDSVDQTPSAPSKGMATIVISAEDFGRVVFGSQDELVKIASEKFIDAVHAKLNTDDGRAEVAKRFAELVQGEPVE
jgi:S-adenosylmethionine hydrolase